MSESEDILEQVRRMGLSEGLTEGGVLKAISDAANTLKRSDYQFERQMGLKEREYETTVERQRKMDELTNIINWIKVASGLGAFGTQGTPGSVSYKTDEMGTLTPTYMRGTQATPNWLQTVTMNTPYLQDWLRNVPFIGGR